MRFGTAPLLDCRRVFHSRDADETRAWLRGKEFHFEPLGRQTRRPDVRMNGSICRACISATCNTA